MNIKFETVRKGNIRKNATAELVLKKDFETLQSFIYNDIKDNFYNTGIESITIGLVIPAKGFKIKIILQNINETRIKNFLKENYSSYIYKGNYTELSNYAMNRIF